MLAPEIAGLAELLDWYREAGVDYVLGDEPIDRFEETRAELAARKTRSAGAQAEPGALSSGPAPSRALPPGPNQGVRLPPDRGTERPARDAAQPIARPTAVASVPGGGEVMAARAAAQSAATLDDLKAILRDFSGCNLRTTAKSLVFSDGNPDARVMLVGEAPGREEDEAGLPFVGRSGQLLDRMLAAIGLDRSSVYIANVVPWRPPGNRTPTPQEMEICKPFIARQIALSRADLLVFLGGASASALVGTTEGILKLRGRWLDYDAGTRRLKALATLHPAYLLRQPLQKRLAWRDFRDLRRTLDQLPVG